MKRKQLFFYLFAISLFATSCKSTYNYTSRIIEVNKKNIHQEENKADIEVDFTKTVKGESSLQDSKNNAQQEAGHNCIKTNGIDIVVDPIYKITTYPNLFDTKYKAEITGYAGYFKNNRSKIGDVKLFDTLDFNNIIKYKLINDPGFSKDYFQKDIKEKIIIVPGGSSGNLPDQSQSLKNDENQNYIKNDLSLDLNNDYSLLYQKAKRMRNAGIGFFVSGIILAGPLGGGLSGVLEVVGPAVFGSIGGAFLFTGIGLWAGGSKKMKKANSNGQFAINYNISPNNASITLNF